jgi:NADH-quinone oxidoreductase E subunit
MSLLQISTDTADKSVKPSISFSPEAKAKFEKILTLYPPGTQAPLLPVLHLAQEEFGYLSLEVQEYVAELMNLPVTAVHEVVSFYTLFKKEPTGKYWVQVCTNLSCTLRGCEKIVDYISRKLGIQVGETTPDKKFTLTTVECLCACEMAPMMQINDEYYGYLTEARVDEILDNLK